MIYVYENKNGFRVVRGNNPTRAKEHLNLEPRVYTDEKSAYAVETNSAIKGAILRLDPSVAEGITPVSQHHVIKNSAKSTSISSKEVYCADCGAFLPGPYGTPGVSMARTRKNTLLCSDCGVIEAFKK